MDIITDVGVINCDWYGKVFTVVTVGKQHVYVWQGFYYHTNLGGHPSGN